MLCQQAQRLFFGFHDHVEREMRVSGSLESIRGLGNKLPEHATRLAAVLTLMLDFHAGEIARREMEAGIELAQH